MAPRPCAPTFPTLLTPASMAFFLALGALAGCGAKPATAPATTTSPSATSTASGAAPERGETRQNPKFGYSWTLPASWQFMADDTSQDFTAAESMNVLAARTKDYDGRILQVLVTDTLTGPPKTVRPPEPEDHERFVQQGRRVLELAKAEFVSSAHVTMHGLAGTEVNGDQGKRRLSVRLFRRQRQLLEFRCSYVKPQADWPCAEALAAFNVVALPEPPPENEHVRVIHLREPSVSLEFDAPDDSWLAVGPRLGRGGTQRVWIWVKGKRRIELQLLDLAQYPGHRNETDFTEGFASQLRASGTKALVKKSVLSRQPCHHLELDTPEGEKRDAFILFLGETNYMLLIAQPERDRKFVETAKKGFRITWD